MKDAARLASDPSLLRLAETALDGAYVLLNAGVITANTILLCRIWQRGLTKGFVSSNPLHERRTLGKQDSRKVMLATCLLTLAGQLGYGSTINTAKNENREQNKPKPTAVKPLTEE